MCGVIGVYCPSCLGAKGTFDLDSGLHQMRSRGPDGQGIKHSYDGKSAIGMCRLRIRSGVDDRIPFSSPDGSEYSFNGQIFEDKSTGAVVNGGWREGDVAFREGACPDGMWAAIKLSNQGEIELSRDPWGIKPLWLRRIPAVFNSDESGWVAASSLPVLIGLNSRPAIRRAAIAQFLTFGRVVDGGSFWEQVRSFPPGGLGLLDQDGNSPEKRLESSVLHMTKRLSSDHDEQSLSRIIRESIEDSVIKALDSDRQIGIAVSGGLDSTIIAWHARNLGAQNINTVSVKVGDGADGIEKGEQIPWLGSYPRSWRHSSVTVRPSDYLPLLSESIQVLGYPSELTSIPLYLALAKLSSEAGITVLLVGEGADEVWGGYRSYLNIGPEEKPMEFYHNKDNTLIARDLVGDAAVEEAIQSFSEKLPDATGPRAILQTERVHSLQPLLERTDQLMMSKSIEARTPFLYGDSWVIASNLEWREMVVGGNTKVRLRAAYGRELPGFSVLRKEPFRAPWYDWLANYFGDTVLETVTSASDALGSIGINPAVARRVVQDGIRGDSASAVMAFRLLTVAIWLDNEGIAT